MAFLLWAAVIEIWRVNMLGRGSTRKVIVNAAGRALYFSRRTIPYLREAASRPVPEQLAAFPFLKQRRIYGYGGKFYQPQIKHRFQNDNRP